MAGAGLAVAIYALEREQKHLIATNYVGLASYTMLIYDHLLTFSDEVEYIWKGHKGLITYLFFINRYFFLFAFIPNLYAYLSPDFTLRLCRHFVRYEGSCVVVGLAIAGWMMMLRFQHTKGKDRVNALYGGNRYVQALLGSIWVVQLSVYAWFLARGMPVPRSLGSRGCSMIFSSADDGRASLSSAIPLVFDTAVLALTVYKIRRALYYKSGTLMSTLLKDGVLYYCTIFSANLALTIMIVTAPPGIKNILGQLAELMTVTMLSRITLHLRKMGNRSTVVCFDDHSSNKGGSSALGNSERALLDPSIATNPLDSVFKTTRAFDAKHANNRVDKGKGSGEIRGEQTNTTSINSAMYGRPVSFAKGPEMTLRRRESSSFVTGSCQAASIGSSDGSRGNLEEV